jgi:hypothetical protein
MNQEEEICGGLCRIYLDTQIMLKLTASLFAAALFFLVCEPAAPAITGPQTSAQLNRARVIVDDRGRWVDTGTERIPIVDSIAARWFGAKPDGSDATAALNQALAAASVHGVTLKLEPGTYGIGNSLDATLTNVVVCGTGSTIIKKLNNGASMSILYGSYTGWTFEGIEFDGNSENLSVYFAPTIVLVESRGVVFRRCKFRSLSNFLTLQGANGVKFLDCRVFGTRSGVMQSGAQNPTPVPAARYSAGISINDGSSDIEIDGCLFHFAYAGIQSPAGPVTNRVRGIKITNNTFRGDWWKNPHVTLRFTPDAYDPATKRLTVNSGPFGSNFFKDYETVCVPVAVTAGGSFTRIYGNEVQSAAFGGVRPGDVIETADGKRAEVAAVLGAGDVRIFGWESVDTFEPATPPSVDTSWRLRRYYATTAARVSGTQLQLYAEPVNVFTGELISAAGIALAGRQLETFAKLSYSGINISGAEDLAITGKNYFRGSWADQISVYDSVGARISDNTVDYGQDEGVTLTRVRGAIVTANRFNYSGVSAIIVGSDHAVISGNTIHSWSIHNRIDARNAAITAQGRNLLVVNNTIAFDDIASYGGLSTYAVSFFLGDSTGSLVQGNTGNGRAAFLYSESSTGKITARDLPNAVAGSGASLVITKQ